MKKRLLVVGLDGATFDLMEPWIKEGRLPNIARVMEEGSYGRLRSTPEKISPAAWTSFATGKNPAKHGIVSFFTVNHAEMKYRILNATYRDGDPIWTYFGKAGKTVGVINVPSTFPADEVNGFMISGWDSPGIKLKGFTYPPEIIDEILKKFGDFPLSPAIKKYRISEKPGEVLKELYRVLDSKEAVTRHYMEKIDWDLFITIFTITDEVQHHFWHYTDDKHPMHKKSEVAQYGNSILDVYVKCDAIVGDLMKELNENDTLVIMSDHGGGINSNGDFFMPNWLLTLGLAKLKEGDQRGDVPFPARVMRSVAGLASRVLNSRAKLFVKKILAIPESRGLEMASKIELSKYDWPNTRVYMIGPTMRINLKGREAHGIVEPGEEYEKLRDFIIEKLKGCKDIKTGRNVFKRVMRREDVLSGKHMEDVPDILFDWQEDMVITGFSCTDAQGNDVKITEESRPADYWSGVHTEYGIFMAKGPDIKPGTKIDNAEIIDVAPTMLHLSGMPVPDDMDGKVLKEIITDEFLASHPVEYSKADESAPKGKGSDYTDEEEKSVEEQLKNMGYM